MTKEEFSAFYVETAGPLHAYLTRMCGDPGLADDLVQSSYIRFLRADSKPRNARARRTYLFRIGANLLRDHWRKESAMQRRAWRAFREQAGAERTADASWKVGGPPARSATASSLETGLEVRRALAELLPRDRQVLWLAYVVGLTHREIAEVLEVEESSVKVIAFRARARFADVLARHGLGPEDLT